MDEIFYDCAMAPSPRRVRMFLAEKGLTPEVREVDLAGGEQKSPEFQKLNPFMTVPVLGLPDGRALSEINAICMYLEETYPEPPLLGTTPADRALTLMWSLRIEMYLIGAIAESFRNYVPRMAGHALPGPFEIEQVPALIERGRKRAVDMMHYLDGHLAERPFVTGEAFTMADITTFVGVDFARSRIKLDIPDDCAALAAWHTKIGERPSAG